MKQLPPPAETKLGMGIAWGVHMHSVGEDSIDKNLGYSMYKTTMIHREP